MRRWVKKQRKWILNIFVLIIIVLVAQQRGGETFEVEKERAKEGARAKSACLCACVRMRGRSAGGMEIHTAFRPPPLPHVNKCKMLQHCGN